MEALGTGQLTDTQKSELMEQLKQQFAVANAQELLTKMTEKCFNQCVEIPGVSFRDYEQRCIAMCMDRFLDSWNLVSKTYANRVQKERQGI